MIEYAVGSSALIESEEALYNMKYRYFVCDGTLTRMNSDVPNFRGSDSLWCHWRCHWLCRVYKTPSVDLIPFWLTFSRKVRAHRCAA